MLVGAIRWMRSAAEHEIFKIGDVKKVAFKFIFTYSLTNYGYAALFFYTIKSKTDLAFFEKKATLKNFLNCHGDDFQHTVGRKTINIKM
ncbi:hypothetical protein [Viridibacillus arvi]|uniref:hypothetical protein n=1 Tax=Viridibacillus arvi TaxID=263475 RepID=UPI0034CE3103